ncbi:hypothetical protein LCGC14_2176270 [marine sediment metagenome]|uniref:Uncharacterized protein n=1 Tax=marine sediment metagenome TaxID=412755 RepID=A0A0F9DNP9_9ZZZZ
MIKNKTNKDPKLHGNCKMCEERLCWKMRMVEDNSIISEAYCTNCGVYHKKKLVVFDLDND